MQNKKFSSDKKWLYMTFFMEDIERAWRCALDVEAWLNVMTAGDGEIKHISGKKGNIGMGLIHTKMPSAPGIRRLNGWFEHYVIVDIDPVLKQLRLKVNTEHSMMMRRKGEKHMFLNINQEPEPDGKYLMTIQFNMNQKPTIVNSTREYYAARDALSTHFHYYEPKED